MLPVIRQYPGIVGVAAVHVGASSVTAETGSPMAETGIEVPRVPAEQASAEMGGCAGSV
jgi:hypothetical protein